MSENLSVDNASNVDEETSQNVVDDDDDDLCEPPSTFSVETFSPYDQKLNW
jgi:hypothetical protein